MGSSYLFKKILIIEDEDIFLKPLAKFLTLNNFQVNIAKNAETGINLNDNINFDIIITDLKMDGLSGVEVIKNISSKYPDSKIIVVSGYIEQNEEFKAVRENNHVVAVYEKPVDFNILLERIKELLR